MTRKNWISLIGFLLCALILISVLNFVFRDKESSFDNFYEEPKNTVDVFFVGSSHVYSGYCPATLWMEYGVSSYNIYGWSLPVWTGYYYLCEGLKYQTPEVVFLDVSCISSPKGTPERIEKTALNREQNLGIKAGLNRFRLLLESITPESESFDLSLFHNRWKDISKLEIVHKPNEEYAFLRNFGALFTQYDYEIFNFDFVEDIVEPSELSQKYLNKIVALSKDKGFELVFVLTPYSATEEETAVTNWVRGFASANNIEFIDFMRDDGDACGFDYHLDMADNDHVNVSGALKLTRYCGDFMRNRGYAPADRINSNTDVITSDSNKTYRMIEYGYLFSDGLDYAKLSSWLAESDDYAAYVYYPESFTSEQQCFIDDVGRYAACVNCESMVCDDSDREIGFTMAPRENDVVISIDGKTDFYCAKQSSICLAIYDSRFGRLTYAVEIDEKGIVSWREYTIAMRRGM